MVELERHYDDDEPQWRDTRGWPIREEETVPGRRMTEGEWQEKRELARRRRRRRRNREENEENQDEKDISIERVKKAYYEEFGRHPKQDGLGFEEAAEMVDTTSGGGE